MTESLKRKQKHTHNLSDWILDYDKKTYNNLKVKDDSKDILIDSFNECSDLRKSFHENLQNIFTDFGFSSMKNFFKHNNSFTLFDNENNSKNKILIS
jgi:hypothetical protein